MNTSMELGDFTPFEQQAQREQQARMGAALRQRMDAVLAHGQYVMGPEVAELEERLSAWCGARHAITCGSGTDALSLPLLAWGVGHGHAVFVPSFSFVSTSAMPTVLGATPVFVDIDPQTRNIDAESLEKAVLRVKREGKLKAKVVIPVGLFGQMCRMPDILDIARAHGLLVVEDATQSFGATRHSLTACNQGCNAAATSFFPAMPLGCYGDGGALFTNDDKLAVRLRALRFHGMDKGCSIRVGINSRMDTLQAAVLLAKLEIFAEELRLRQTVAEWYYAALPDCVETPQLAPGCTSTWALFTVLMPDTPDAPAQRQALQAHLEQAGVPTHIEYAEPQHCLPAFADLGYRADDLPASLNVSRRILSLPLHPYMREDEVRRVCMAMRQFFEKSKV